jgi:hypothetical protein
MGGRSSFALGVALLLALALPASTTLARFTDSVSSSGSIAADTLNPPTLLAAAGGSAVTLTWVPSVDLYATGYAVYRSATSGTGYALVSSVTPGSATTTTDSPGTGTWYYVLKTTFQNWSSANTAEVSATVSVATSSAFVACVGASNLADASGAGDNNGYETNPSKACVSDSAYAVDTNSGNGGTQSCGTGATPDAAKDRHRFWGFAFGLPGSVSSINGIRLQADLKLDAIAGSHNLCAQLSWDGGTTWTAIKGVVVTAAAKTTYTFGSTADNWGHSWSLAQLNTTNFRIRIIDASTVAGRDFSLDYVALSVTYNP